MIEEHEIESIFQFSSGLFIVAAFALGYTFRTGRDVAVTKFKRLLKGLRDGLDTRATVQLDLMYKFILDEATREYWDEDPETLFRLLASLLTARMPLSITTLGELLGTECYDVRASLNHLHAVIDVPDREDVAGLRTLHATFGDYLIRYPQLHDHITLAHGYTGVGQQLDHSVTQSRSSNETNSSTEPNITTFSPQVRMPALG